MIECLLIRALLNGRETEAFCGVAPWSVLSRV